MVVGEFVQEMELLIIGGGPGGYVAALAAADAGIQTALVEEAKVPGGVCLREGCIPSKALLHVAGIIDLARHAESFGITFTDPKTDIDKLRSWKNGIIRKLSGGVKSLLKARKVEYFNGHAAFESPRIVRIEGDEPVRVKFRHCIIATGSRAKMLP
ncbi:MAG: FAD-dependent oxidoreductase, partial [Phycisphaerae bacterium]